MSGMENASALGNWFNRKLAMGTPLLHDGRARNLMKPCYGMAEKREQAKQTVKKIAWLSEMRS